MNELPKRKQIRLKYYDYSQNGYYFVTICIDKRRHIFGEIVGATLCGRPNNPDKMIEKWLLEIENKFKNVKIPIYVIMPNHIHCIVEKTGDHAGSRQQDIVGWFKSMTTNEYIKNVKQNLYLPFDGKLWQRGYYEHIIRNENEYIEICKYIDENPIKWESDKYYE